MSLGTYYILKKSDRYKSVSDSGKNDEQLSNQIFANKMRLHHSMIFKVSCILQVIVYNHVYAQRDAVTRRNRKRRHNCGIISKICNANSGLLLNNV